MKKLQLSIATEDYDHFRDFRLGMVQAEGIEHIWLMPELHEIFARFTFNREWDVSELSFAKFMAQVTRPNPDIVGAAGGGLAPLPVLGLLCEPQQQDHRAGRPQGQEGRIARMGPHGRRLYAGLAAGRGRRQASGHPLVPGRHQRARADREGRAEPAQGRQAHPRRRQVPEQHAGRGRDRLRAGGASARLLHAAAPGRGAAVSGLSGDGGEILRPHQGVADHARDRDEAADPRPSIPGWRAASTTHFTNRRTAASRD